MTKDISWAIQFLRQLSTQKSKHCYVVQELTSNRSERFLDHLTSFGRTLSFEPLSVKLGVFATFLSSHFWKSPVKKDQRERHTFPHLRIFLEEVKGVKKRRPTQDARPYVHSKCAKVGNKWGNFMPTFLSSETSRSNDESQSKQGNLASQSFSSRNSVG